MLRWAVDHGYAVIPLSTNEHHLKDNFAIREFSLLPYEVEALDGLSRDSLLHGSRQPSTSN
jgi:diketogulonate reductase-like aldo/keto reductase